MAVRSFLRLHQDPSPAILAHIAATEYAYIDCADDAERLRLAGILSEQYRLIGRLAEAITFGETAIALAESLQNDRALVANLIRMATALQYADRHTDAQPLFIRALDLTADADPSSDSFAYRDFALQHFGKCLVEMGRYADARSVFLEARGLRVQKGDAGLLVSTEEALKTLEGLE